MTYTVSRPRVQNKGFGTDKEAWAPDGHVDIEIFGAFSLPSSHPPRLQRNDCEVWTGTFRVSGGGFGLTRCRSLEFNIRQLILTDLARNIGECKDHASEHDLTPAIDLLTSHVQTRDQPAQDAEDGEDGEEQERIFMVCQLSPSCPRALARTYRTLRQSAATIQCNIGFAELAVNLSDEHSANTIPVLIDILKDVPHIDFDSSLAWEGNYWVDTPLFGVRAHEFHASRLGITRPTCLLRRFLPAPAGQLLHTVWQVYH